MPDPKQIMKDNAGAIESRRRRSTWTVVTIYRNSQAGLDDVGGAYPYSMVCEEHGFIIAVHRLDIAQRQAPRVDEWCERCMAEAAMNDYNYVGSHWHY